MASKQGILMPASYINTRLVLFPRIAIPSGDLEIPHTLTNSHQAVNAPMKQHVHFSRVTFTAPSTAFGHIASRRRQHNSSEETASISEYFQGHTDEAGCQLGRRPTPYPSRKICGVEWTSITTCTDDSPPLSSDSDSNSEAAEKHVHFALDTTDFGSELTRTPTPYPHNNTGSGCGKRDGLRKWCAKLKRKLCPVKEPAVTQSVKHSSSIRAMFGEEEE